MHTVSFSVELGISPRFENDSTAYFVKIEELGSVLQKYANEVEEKTGIILSAIIKGPNRSCYKKELGSPDGGEITYTICGNSNHLIQAVDKPYPDIEWKRAVIILVDLLMKHYEQEYTLIEFIDGTGVDSYVLTPDRNMEQLLSEVQ